MATRKDSVVGTDRAFCGILQGGALVVWGDPEAGGLIPGAAAYTTGVVEVAATSRAFCALGGDGKILTAWGDPAAGAKAPQVGGITALFGASRAFAALRSDGSVIAWGDPDKGGTVPADIAALKDIVSVHPGGAAFAALRRDGSVVAWGDAGRGGTVPAQVAALTNIVDVVGSGGAFGAVRAGEAGAVFWGSQEHGVPEPGEAVFSEWPVVQMCATERNFAVTLEQETSPRRTATMWSRPDDMPPAYGLQDVEGLLANDAAVVGWSTHPTTGKKRLVAGGDPDSGGRLPQLATMVEPAACAATRSAFAVRTAAGAAGEGYVLAWGDESTGGKIPDDTHRTLADVNVQAIYGNGRAFFALGAPRSGETTDPAVVAWGDPDGGGLLPDDLIDQIRKIPPTRP